MRDFTHDYLNRAYPRWKVHPEGGMTMDAWFLVPGGVNSDPSDPYFDGEKISELADAAAHYARSKGLSCEIYVIGS